MLLSKNLESALSVILAVLSVFVSFHCVCQSSAKTTSLCVKVGLDTLPRLGLVCIDECGHIALARALDFVKDTLSTWLPRKAQVFAAEGLGFTLGVFRRQ